MYYTEFQYFSVFCSSCFCSSYWLCNKGKIKFTSHLPPLPCSTFGSVLDIGTTAHFAWYFTDIHATDTAGYTWFCFILSKLMCWVCLGSCATLLFLRQKQRVTVARKKFAFWLGREEWMLLEHSFSFKVCFCNAFQILL